MGFKFALGGGENEWKLKANERILKRGISNKRIRNHKSWIKSIKNYSNWKLKEISLNRIKVRR